LLLEYTD
nr:mouse glutathione S-transferase homolog peptide 38-6 [hamsters, Chinese hamster ovary cells, Peptide Partial, 7 aa] [Cricetinae]